MKKLKNVNFKEFFLKNKKYLPWVGVALLVIFLAILPALAKNNGEEEDNRVVKSAEAATRDVDTVLIGGGQLESNGVFDIEIPETVKIKEFVVGNGDAVKKGDPIAVVDSVSVMSAISDAQEKLEDLEDDMHAAYTSSSNSYIASAPEGTVKAVYASVGDDVVDVMLEHGCLAVISLDDTMAVEIETDADISVGDKVNVLVNDETVTGKVRTNLEGTVTITIPDNKYAIDQAVAVYSLDGEVIGTGTLYVYSAYNVSGYSGTVSYVYIKENDSVYEDQNLFQVTETEDSDKYQSVLDERQKYEDLMAELFEMYSTGYVVSPCDGIVSGIDTDGSFMLSAQLGTQSEYSVVSLVQTSFDGGVYQLNDTQPETDPTVKTYADPTGITPTTLDKGTVKTAYVAQLSVTVADPTTTTAYPGTWNLLQTTPSTGANLALDANTGVLYGMPSAKGLYALTVSYTWTDDSGTQKSITTEVPLSLTIEESATPGGGGGNTPGGGDSGGGMSGGGGTAMSGMTNGSTTTTEDEDSAFDTVTIATVTSQEEMTLTITIDELDITKVYIGQEATITMNAFAEDPVEATVVNISTDGENNGGNSKYSVKLQLGKSSDMLPGMNATATIVLNTETDALCVPAAAVYEVDGEYVVYTSYNSGKDLLKKPVTVEVGVADANYVQILSGIDEGTKVYYEIYESEEAAQNGNSV